VYLVENVTAPEPIQVLPSQASPEGVFAIPERNLLVVASESDDRASNLRGAVTIYELVEAEVPVYPTIISGPINPDEPDGPYIPFSALSGLGSDAPPTIPDGNEDILYSVEDSFFKSSRMFIIDTSSYPALITGAIRLSDSLGTLAEALQTLPEELAVNTSAVTLINPNDSVNLDLEGIGKSVDGGFWIVSEGAGTVGDEENPYEYPNMLLKVSASGVIQEVIFLPVALAMEQVRYGFEGVAEDGDYVVAAIQRAWDDEPNPRLAIYNKSTAEFTFVYYPLDVPESQAESWVGVSDIAPLGDGMFMVLERDNQFGPDAAVKRLYQIGLGDFSMGVPVEDEDVPTVEKTLVLDVIPEVEAFTGAKVMEKLEGLAVTASGNVYINNDNDGVEDNSGEELLLDLGVIPLNGNMSSATDSPSEGSDSGADEGEESGSGAFSFDMANVALSVMLSLGYVLFAL
jgi:hypothetical protein